MSHSSSSQPHAVRDVPEGAHDLISFCFLNVSLTNRSRFAHVMLVGTFVCGLKTIKFKMIRTTGILKTQSKKEDLPELQSFRQDCVRFQAAAHRRNRWKYRMPSVALPLRA